MDEDGSRAKIMSLTSALGNVNKEVGILRQDLRKSAQEVEEARGTMHDILNLANECNGYVDVDSALGIMDDIRRIVVNFLNRRK